MPGSDLLPTFIIIGAQKSGTTSLYRYITQHPDIFGPDQKETGFFVYRWHRPRFSGPKEIEPARQGIACLEDYKALFRSGRQFKARGEASPIYLYWPKAAQSIASLLPDIKIIAVLRDPAERAFSAYLHNKRLGIEPEETFESALINENWRIHQGWSWAYHYLRRGAYYNQVSRYFRCFESENIFICRTRELAKSPGDLVRRVFSFLEVDVDFVPELSRNHNPYRPPVIDRAARLIGQSRAKALVPDRYVSMLNWVLSVSPISTRPQMPKSAGYYVMSQLKRDLGRLDELLGTKWSEEWQRKYL